MSRGGTQLAWGACTDRGLKRAKNEDAYLAEFPVFLVADGMGGHEAGAEASQRALAAFRPLVDRSDITGEDVRAAFDIAVREVESIHTERFAPGTTLAGVVLCELSGSTYWLVLNIGDSRTYLFSDGRLEQISIDHSAVQALVERGQLLPSDAERHPDRNVVTRAVGGGSSGDPDYWMLPAQAGDRMLVCSDGLTKELAAEQIRAVLVEEASAQGAATRLVHESLLSGGRDNTTVVVVDAHGVIDVDDAPTASADVVDEDTRPRSEVAEGGLYDAQV